MWHDAQELINVASIRKASADVVLPPINVIDSLRNVRADGVILFNLLERHVGIVDTNEDDASAVDAVDEDFVVELGHGNTAIDAVDVEMDRLFDAKAVIEAHNAPRASVNIQRDVPVSCELP